VKPAARELSIANLHPRLKLERRDVTALVAALDAAAEEFGGGCPAGALSIAFLTDEALASLHARFLNDPSPTDVITFTGSVEARARDPGGFGQGTLEGAASSRSMAGEICVSADAAARRTRAANADARRAPASPRKTQGSEDAYARELTLYLVHGWLHLAGYDDLNPSAKRRMRRAEARAMRIIERGPGVPIFRMRAFSVRSRRRPA